jgi:formamidopyrimidine-DNA glycosylase|tara:strand:+ start:167 stop:1006 length:840 start_codon:yes stop_codon:yes gene_type:complete
MPEAPDLEIIKDYLNANLKDATVESCKVLRSTVVRSLAGEITSDLPGRTFLDAQRRGKFLTLRFSGGRSLVINPMLTGALQHCQESVRVQKKTCISLGIGGGMGLRYLDDRQMGKVYYIDNGEYGGDAQDELVPQYTGLGPDVLSGITFEDFQARLKKFNGEIKGVLTRGAFISGIGNAYSDEILFAAEISPFKKCRALKPEELKTLHAQCRQVLEEATETLRVRMGGDIHKKVRDFLQVHNKGGQPCPKCGGNITQLNANQRITSYCRHCQPGMLIRN